MPCMILGVGAVCPAEAPILPAPRAPLYPAPAALLCLPCSLLPSCHPLNPPSPTTPSGHQSHIAEESGRTNWSCPQEASGLSLDENHAYPAALKSARHQVMEQRERQVDGNSEEGEGTLQRENKVGVGA